MASQSTLKKAILTDLARRGGELFTTMNSSLEADLGIGGELRKYRCSRSEITQALDSLKREGRIRFKTRDGLRGVVLIQTQRDVRAVASHDRYASSHGAIGSRLTNQQCGELSVSSTVASETQEEDEMSSFAQVVAELVEDEVATRVAAVEAERDELQTRLDEALASIEALRAAAADAQREADKLRVDAEKFRSARELFAA